MPERLLEQVLEKQTPIVWPPLDNAENLEHFTGDERRRVKTLALYEKRRSRNMSPPSLREIGTYLKNSPEDRPISTSVVKHMLTELTTKGYLNNWSDGKEILSRGQTIKVDFGTIKLKDQSSPNIFNFPDIPGLTGPKKIKQPDPQP